MPSKSIRQIIVAIEGQQLFIIGDGQGLLHVANFDRIEFKGCGKHGGSTAARDAIGERICEHLAEGRSIAAVVFNETKAKSIVAIAKEHIEAPLREAIQVFNEGLEEVHERILLARLGDKVAKGNSK